MSRSNAKSGTKNESGAKKTQAKNSTAGKSRKGKASKNIKKMGGGCRSRC